MEYAQSRIYYVDSFLIPRCSLERFVQQLNYNRAFVAGLAGYLRGEVFRRDTGGEVRLITIAVWEDNGMLQQAKRAMKAEFDRLGFDPARFCRELNVTMTREQYVDLWVDDDSDAAFGG